MTEQKKQQQQLEAKVHPKQNPGGMFQKFLSDVATAGQAVLKEAQAMQNPKPGSGKTNTQCNTQKVVPVKESYPQMETTMEPKTTLPPTTPKPIITPTAVVEVPKDVISPPAVVASDDWELLSTEERTSRNSQSNGSFVACPRAGSVRSIASVDQESSSHATLSVPFKIQRTSSSSTLDSQDNALGPSGKGVLGVDYIEHVVLSTDTLQGICIAYKVSATHLRRANHFSGTLHSAPKKLVIPISKQALRTGFIRVQDTDTKEYKLHSFLAEFSGISEAEAKSYLELADWELKDAMRSAKEDREWDSADEGVEVDDEYNSYGEKNLKSGQIGIKVKFRKGIPTFDLRGTGFPSFGKKSKKAGSSSCSSSNSEKTFDEKEKVIIYKRPPAIATKSVLAQDLYDAAPQHGAFGFELQPISKK
jgi:LysM repeat protein